MFPSVLQLGESSPHSILKHLLIFAFQNDYKLKQQFVGGNPKIKILI